jgi:hypothetical protein|mmetsp:Transcript_65255/g.179060  ORF Transcript_65255/g.179060 Transcript_65255/m.179060 type:complete len:219 (-) Transcript_65255:1796-2452(-)
MGCAIDAEIKPQGLGETYTFTDADDGPAGGESEPDEEEEEDIAEVSNQRRLQLAPQLAAAKPRCVARLSPPQVEEGEEGALEEEVDEEGEDGMEDSEDSEDDTVDNLWLCGEAPEVPSVGYTYALCPPLETPERLSALVGRRILLAHITDPIGLHMGCVRFSGVGAKWKKLCATANFLIRYTKKETTGDMTEGQEEVCELSVSNYGRDEWWLLLNPIV